MSAWPLAGQGLHRDRAPIAKRRRLEAVSLQLEQRSPFQPLERSDATAYDVSGNVLRSLDQAATGDEIYVRLARYNQCYRSPQGRGLVSRFVIRSLQ